MLKGILLAFLGSAFPVILFNIDRKKIIWAGLCGAFGWAVYLFVFSYTNSTITSSFCGTLAVGFYSEIMARVKKTPASQFSIPGIFPLVPGISLYNTVRFIVEGNYKSAEAKAFETVAVGGAIAFGIMISTTTVTLILRAIKGRAERLQ